MEGRPITAWCIAAVIRGLAVTVRLRFVDEAGYLDPARQDPCIIVLWHNLMLVAPLFYTWHRRFRPVVVLTSASRDGELLAGVMQCFGLGAVRGSSSRRGAIAMRSLIDAAEQGKDVVITPDGPRGPVYTVGPGLIYLAQKTGMPIMRVQVRYESFWQLKSWDRFRIPKPFSKIELTVKPFDRIDPDGSPEVRESERLRIESALRAEVD